MLLRGWGYVSTNPYATPRFHSNREWSVSSFSMRIDRQVAPDIYSWHCLERLSVREGWYDSLSASYCMRLCVWARHRDRKKPRVWSSFPAKGLQLHSRCSSQPEGRGGTYSLNHTHIRTPATFPYSSNTDCVTLWFTSSVVSPWNAPKDSVICCNVNISVAASTWELQPQREIPKKVKGPAGSVGSIMTTRRTGSQSTVYRSTWSWFSLLQVTSN